jgi:solute carrier family 41
MNWSKLHNRFGAAQLSTGSSILDLHISASRKFHVNPDNVATPIAAALGDLVTLALLSLVATSMSAGGHAPLALLAVYVIIAIFSYR